MSNPRLLGENRSATFGYGYGYGSCQQQPSNFTIEVKETAGLFLIYLTLNLDEKPFYGITCKDMTEKQFHLSKKCIKESSPDVMLELLQSIGTLRELEAMREASFSGVELGNVVIAE